MTADNRFPFEIHGPRCGKCFGLTPDVNNCDQCNDLGMVEPVMASFPIAEARELLAMKSLLRRIVIDKDFTAREEAVKLLKNNG